MNETNNSWQLVTDDVVLQLGIDRNAPVIRSLTDRAGVEWARAPSVVKLPGRLAMDGKRCVPDWAYAAAEWTVPRDGEGTMLTLRFHDLVSGLELRSVWTAYTGPGPIRHQLILHNKTKAPIMLYEPESLDIVLGVDDPVDVFYVHKDRAAATIVSYMRSGYGTYREPLYDRYAMDIWTKPDDDDTGFIPLVMLHAECGQGHGLYVGWAWNHGRIAVRGTRGEDRLAAEIRAGMFDDFSAEIWIDRTLELPAAFIGLFQGDMDDGSNRLRKWLFQHHMPAINRTNEQLPAVAWNAFVSTAVSEGAWLCEEKNYDRMIDDIAKAGFEEVMIDVGWWEAYGDWRASAKRWPRGMRAASDCAREKGLDFGLYFTLTNGESEHPDALTSEGPNKHPEWLMDHLKADLGVEACKTFVTEQLNRRFDEYGVDVLRTDYDPVITRKAEANNHRGSNDAAYWSEAAFVDMLDRFYANRPGFRYQNCSGGGALKGYAIMERSSAVQVTDYFEAINIRRAMWDSVYCFPLMQLLTQFGDSSSGGSVGSAGYRFRTFLMGAPSMHVELPSEMSAEDRATLVRLIQSYKHKVRPLVRYANVYHNLPRPDGVTWDGYELYDPDTGRGVTMIFKPDSEVDEWTVRWKGLEPAAVYDVTFEDGTNPSVRMSGKELIAAGYPVRLEGRHVAEWMFVERVDESNG